ncbi:MAG: peptidylprolyl isomerase [Bacteroidetes bacterium]|nr:peptidylprolyl isomerase [Bacteroidota bacterium]
MKKTLLVLIIIFFSITIQRSIAQEKIVDQIVAIVGANIVKLSDIETQYSQYMAQGLLKGENEKCNILEELLFQKLLLNQAQLDSIVISDNQIESELDRRLRYFIKQIGSQEKLEEYYNKSIVEIKFEFREAIKEQLLAQNMQSKITENIKITPSEVKTFYNNIPKDSLPLIPSVVEIGQIVKQPPLSIEETKYIKEKLTGFRDRVLKGENFSALAVLYSEDPGSAKKGGELGFFGKGEMFPEFEAASFALKANDVSPVIETKAGFHIIQLIERRGEMINVKHILLMPKVAPEDLSKAKISLDTIYAAMESKKISFADAALKYSDDPSKANKGIMVNPQSGSSKFKPDELDPSVFFVIDKLKNGEFSKPVPMKTEDGKQAYRILYLKSKTEPHRANLNDDYDSIQEMALNEKRSKAIAEWINVKAAATYINIVDEFKKCNFQSKWIN